MSHSTDHHSDKYPGMTGPHALDMEGWISCAPYEQLLGMEIALANDGAAVLTMPFLKQYAQGAGLMHGGALISLADTALVMAIKSILEPYTHFATIHMEANYLKPVTQGVVTAHARLTWRQERLIYGEADVLREDGEQVLSFSARFKVARDTQIRQVNFADDLAER